MAGKSWRVQAAVVRLGIITLEPVAEDRQLFHEWLAKRFGRSINVSRPALYTKYIPAEQIRQPWRGLREILDFVVEDGERVLSLIDCSPNHYETMRENLIAHVSECAVELAGGPDQVCVILLPRFPSSNHSPFWTLLEQMGDRGGSVVVINNEGQMRSFGKPVRATVPPDAYETRQRKLSGTLEEEFADKTVRRMGHFKIGQEGYCSRYFFDVHRAVRELSQLLVEKISTLTKAELARTTLLVPEGIDPWMDEAIAIAEESIKVGRTTWPVSDGPLPKSETYRKHLVVIDFVNTGGTFRNLVDAALDAGYEFHQFAIAAFVGDDFHNENAKYPTVLHIQRVKFDRSPHGECTQCSLGLPYTSNRGEGLIGLRSFDAWEIMTKVTWKEEGYGPPPHRRHRILPDFEEMFSLYGDYLAFKLENVLRHVSQKAEVAVVCPDEPAIRSIVNRMQPWADNRIATVRLPRETLELSGRVDSADLAVSDEDSEWARQLRHLAGRNASVVLTDEFNGSNITAKRMISVLHAFKLQARAYAPIFNFVPNEPLQDVQVVALYDIPSPRSALL